VCFEESYWDIFGAYRTLASFCAFNCIECQKLRDDHEGRNDVMNILFLTAGKDGPAILRSCGVSTMIPSGWSNPRFFPFPFELKGRNAGPNVSLVCNLSVDIDSAEDLMAIHNLPPGCERSSWGGEQEGMIPETRHGCHSPTEDAEDNPK